MGSPGATISCPNANRCCSGGLACSSADSRWWSAAAVCETPALEEALVLEDVGALVDNNLVRTAGVVAGEQRYSMLETIREFAAERLEIHGETQVTRGRHLAWYLDLAEHQRSPALHGVEWLARFDAELDNFRAALLELQRCCDPELGPRIVAAIDRAWNMRGHFVEARAWLDRLLPLSKQRTAARASRLSLAGFLAMRQNDDKSATPLFVEALDIRRELGDPHGVVSTLYQFAVVPHHQETSVKRKQCSRRVWRSHAPRASTTLSRWGLLFLADLVLDRGDFRHATLLYEEALAAARPRGNTHSRRVRSARPGPRCARPGPLQPGQPATDRQPAALCRLRDQRCVPLCLEGLACIAVGTDWAERATRPWARRTPSRRRLAHPRHRRNCARPDRSRRPRGAR